MESTSLLIAIGGMFALGFSHAFGPDHLAAIATLTGREAKWQRVFGTSMRFALGHSLLLMLCGVGAFLFGFLPSEGAVRIAETAGGILLVGLGAVMLHAMAQGKSIDEHGHGDSGSFFLGGILAASGTRSFLLAIPAAASSHSFTGSLLVAGAFGLGVVLGMCAFGLLWGWGKQTYLTSPRARFAANLSTASLTIMLGLYWSVAEWL